MNHATSPTAAGEYTYWGFISYSQKDAEWAQWLQRALEGYRLPKRLVGTPCAWGAVPHRVHPFFRDRDDLAASSDLDDRVREALAASRYLIVVCSPAAVASKWVSAEVEWFKALGRADRILCIVVAGEPGAADGIDADACFPLALLDAANRSSVEPDAPLAADARAGKDGRHHAVLKLLAGMLGVAFDVLRQRDRERRRRRLAVVTVATAATLALFAGLAYEARLRGAEAESRRLAARASALRGDPLQALSVAIRAVETGATIEARNALYRALLRGLPPTILSGHTDAVNYVSFSPNATLLASADASGVVRLWDVATAKQVRVLRNGSSVEMLSFSPDGTILAATAVGGTVTLWAVADGAKLRTVDTTETDFPSIFFSSDGRLLVTLNDSRIARVWNVADGSPTGVVKTGAFFPDPANRAVLVTVDDEEMTIRLWDVRSGVQVAMFEADDYIKLVRFTPDGRRLMAVSARPGLSVWDVGTGDLVARLQAENDGLDADLTPDGRRALVWNTVGHGQIWDLESTKSVTVLGSLYYAQFSPKSGRYLLDVGPNIYPEPAVLRDAESGDQLLSLAVQSPGRQSVYRARFSPDEQGIAFAPDLEKDVHLYSISDAAVLAEARIERQECSKPQDDLPQWCLRALEQR